MRNTFQRCAARIVLVIPLATFSMAPVSAGPILGTAGTFAILGGAGVAVNGTGSVITGSGGRLLRRYRGHRLSRRFHGFWRNCIQHGIASYRS